MKEAERLQKEELGTAQYGVTKFSDLTGLLPIILLFVKSLHNFFHKLAFWLDLLHLFSL